MAGDGLPRRRRRGPRRGALPAGRSPARARRSVLWRARYWSCRWRWRRGRSDGCGGTPLRQDVEQETPDELVGRERHRAKPRLPVAAIVLVAEGHAALVEADQAAVRDGDAVGVAGEIGEHRLGPGALRQALRRRLGVEEPFLPPERGKMCGKGLPATQAIELAEERQRTRRVGIGEPGQEEPSEQAGEHADGEEEAGSA